jgi:hypothetical protein
MMVDTFSPDYIVADRAGTDAPSAVEMDLSVPNGARHRVPGQWRRRRHIARAMRAGIVLSQALLLIDDSTPDAYEADGPASRAMVCVTDRKAVGRVCHQRHFGYWDLVSSRWGGMADQIRCWSSGGAQGSRPNCKGLHKSDRWLVLRV